MGGPPVLTYARPPRGRWRVVIVLLIACSLYPLFALGMIYANAVCAWASLGHWPRPFIDPAATVIDGVTLRLVRIVLPVLVLTAAVAVVGVILVITSEEPAPRGAVLALLLPVATWGVTLLLMAWDPLDVVKWFVD
jgi:hypothetical protein